MDRGQRVQVEPLQGRPRLLQAVPVWPPQVDKMLV